MHRPIKEKLRAAARVNNGAQPSSPLKAGSANGTHGASTSNDVGTGSTALSLAGMLLPDTGLGTSHAATATRGDGPALVVFSGGTAFNSIAGKLKQLTSRVAYVLPVSDDGGSTAEIVRVLGGPAVGDIRSRCLRLADARDEEARAVKELLAYRLSATDADAARLEWYSIVEGEHRLWGGVSEPYKHVIRAFLVHFHAQILAHAGERFNFKNGSIGNFFFAGSRTFFRSLEAAVFLFARVARIAEGSRVLPAIATEERITLGAELEDGTVIKGQNQISHPPASGRGAEVDKSLDGCPPLPAPIRRVFYLSSEGSGQEHEVLPRANPGALSELERCDAIVYGCGSLYTSICPCVCLDGVGEAVAARSVPKIMLLNGGHDRETASCGSHDGPMTAADMVQAVCDALNRRRNRRGQRLRHAPSAYVTALIVPRSTGIRVDRQALHLLGVRHVVDVDSVPDTSTSSGVLFEPGALVEAIEEVLRLEHTPSVGTAGYGSTTLESPARWSRSLNGSP